MRAVTSAARRPQGTPVTPPPTYQEHEVTLRLPHHVYELATWAYAYEQRDDYELARMHKGRTFAVFLADAIEEGLETTVGHWEMTQAEAAPKGRRGR